MGSFRSQPDNEKHSKKGGANGFQYAVSHMCGTRCDIQGGGFTWKMHTSLKPN